MSGGEFFPCDGRFLPAQKPEQPWEDRRAQGINADHIPECHAAGLQPTPPISCCLSSSPALLSVCPSVCLSARPAALRGHVPLRTGCARGPALRPLLCTHVTLTPRLLLCARLNCPSQLAVISDSVQISKRSVSVPPGNPQGRAGVLHASCPALAAAAAARQINDRPCEGLA